MTGVAVGRLERPRAVRDEREAVAQREGEDDRDPVVEVQPSVEGVEERDVQQSTDNARDQKADDPRALGPDAVRDSQQSSSVAEPRSSPAS